MGQRRRPHVHAISRTIVCVVTGTAIGTLFWTPGHVASYAADVLLRAYLVFLGTVMAHEAVHGHLGRTRRANVWWGRVALLGSMVPFTNFKKTHQLHHAHTNDPDRDPDYFLRARSPIDLVLRAVAMPHHWFFWLRARGMMDRRDLRELVDKDGLAAARTPNAHASGPSRRVRSTMPEVPSARANAPRPGRECVTQVRECLRPGRERVGPEQEPVGHERECGRPGWKCGRRRRERETGWVGVEGRS